jgi:outer membrane receptor protein involved in Fe transport
MSTPRDTKTTRTSERTVSQTTGSGWGSGSFADAGPGRGTSWAFLGPLVLLALLLPSLALADSRVEARKRFKLGMSLIHDERYEEGIDQLLEAYSIKPHPNVLFNVAKAYEALRRYDDALAYYRKYLDSDPPDAADTRKAIARLEPLVPKVKPREPEAVTQPPPARPAEPQRPVVDEATLAKLSALTERLETAITKAEERAAALEKQHEEPAKPSATAAQAPAAAEEDEEAGSVPYEETVVTASRRAQSTLEAPNATTIITGEEIRMSGARSLPELLRRVPGADVMMMGVDSADVSFRGFNERIANKVLLLIDGRPEYEDFLGITLWPAIPIELNEIERIEIVRGPGSALYGANAMLGVINIITRAPGTGPAFEAKGWGGNGLIGGGSLVASGGSKLRYRASAGYDQEDKWSRDYADNRPDIVSQVPDSSLGYRSARANAVATYSFNRDFSVSASAGVNKLFTEIYPIGILRNFYLDGVGGYAKADALLGPVKLKFWWENLTAVAGPQYWPVGERTIGNSLQSNVFDFEAVFQKEFTLLGRHRITVGASGRLKRLAWTYTGDLKQEVHGAGFAQEEWQPVRPLTLTGSYRVDYHPLLGYLQSPRVSAVWQFIEGQAIRASFATAFREPTFSESYTNIATPIPGVNGASLLTQGSTTLRPERLLSAEAGYRGEAARFGLEYDLALYWNWVNDLIVLSAVNPLPPAQAYDPTSGSYLLGQAHFQNDPNGYVARGAELGVTWSATRGLDIRVSAAVQQVIAQNPAAVPVCGPCTEAPAFKVFAGVMYRTPVGLDISVDGAYVSSTVWVEREPDPANPTQIVNIQNPLHDYVVVNARAGYRFLDDRVSVAVVGTQLGPQHQEHPFGNLITQRVMGTLTVRP